MSSLGTKLLELYAQLGGLAFLGFLLGRMLPPVVPIYVGKFLFWIAVPISVIAFLRRSDLSGSIGLAPAIAWLAILLGAGLSWGWLKITRNERSEDGKTPQSSAWSKPTQGSFLLASMVGNTGYIGYPVILALVGEKYFAWALFYDLLGTVIGCYGLGVALAARFGEGERKNNWQLTLAMLNNPTLWALGLGLWVRDMPLPSFAEQSLQSFAWSAIALSLVLIGMRLSQLHSWSSVKPASLSLLIKMLVVPLLLGSILSQFGFNSTPLLILVLQMAMPPAFATLVLAEAYNLDRDLTVTALAIGSVGLLLTLPLWLWLFGI